jgi:hypothetical protein
MYVTSRSHSHYVVVLVTATEYVKIPDLTEDVKCKMLKVDLHISQLMRRVCYYKGSSIDFILDHGCSFDDQSHMFRICFEKVMKT